MFVKCEMLGCRYNIFCAKEFICSKDNITIGHGNKNGEWVFAECMDYTKEP